MFSEDEEETDSNGSARGTGSGAGQADAILANTAHEPSVEQLFRDYNALLETYQNRSAYLKCRLRQLGVSDQKIRNCHTQKELVGLILFEPIPAPLEPDNGVLIWLFVLFLMALSFAGPA